MSTPALLANLSTHFIMANPPRPFEFTVTPMQNVPLGLIKSKGFHAGMLTESQFAMYYASYRHLYKMALRNARKESKGNPVVKAGVSSVISIGGWTMMKFVERLARRAGVDIEKVKHYGLKNETAKIETVAQFNK